MTFVPPSPDTPVDGLPYPFWVFGYGSLMWDPGFPHVEARAAALPGYRRALCVVSRRHRGTAEVPGLVMGLAPAVEVACTGMAFRVAPAHVAAVRAYLWEREVPGYIYREATVAIDLGAATPGVRRAPGVDGETGGASAPGQKGVLALTYLPDPSHADFVPDLADAEIAARVAAATGGRGPNRDYLRQTVDHLRALGIEEPGLEGLYARFFG